MTQIISNIEKYDMKIIDGDLHLIPIIEVKRVITEDNITYSKIIKTKFNKKIISIPTYSGLLIHIIENIKKEFQINVKDIVDLIDFNYKIGKYRKNGYHYKKKLKISLQYKSSFDTLKAIKTLIKHYNYSLIITILTDDDRYVKYKFIY